MPAYIYLVKQITIIGINEKLVIPISNILYCEADCNYTYICLASGEKHTVSLWLKAVERLIEHQYFCRIHKSFLVNTRYVSVLPSTKNKQITLTNGEVLLVSRRNKDELISICGQ